MSYDTPFGSGRDGNVTLGTDTVLGRDMYYNNLTIGSGVSLNANGYVVRVANVLSLTSNSRVHNNGQDCGAYNVPSQGGGKGTLGGGGSGGIQVVGSLNGSSVTSYSLGGAGGAGGSGRGYGSSGTMPGGTGGTVVSVPDDIGGNLAVKNQLDPFFNGRTATGVLYKGGGGGGAGGIGSTELYYLGGTGGGGGGVLVVAAKTISHTASGNSYIEANGGKGGNFKANPTLGYGSGPGGGGGGGSCVVITTSINPAVVVRANGGLAGTDNSTVTGPAVAGQNGMAVVYNV